MPPTETNHKAWYFQTVLSLFILLGHAVDTASKLPIPPGLSPGIPGDSLVKLCPESQPDDLFAIERIINRPQTPYLDDDIDVFIWGTLARDISQESTVSYQINATANTGDFGALNGTFHICDYLEQMYPPGSNSTEKVCPPRKGPVIIDYAMWLADWLVAPGLWSVKFDAKTPEGERIYCLLTEFDLQCPPWHTGPECLRDELVKKIPMFSQTDQQVVKKDNWKRNGWPMRRRVDGIHSTTQRKSSQDGKTAPTSG